jgi:CRP/FNR family cyclic AMP-dependent transcriptional regulator
MAAESSYNRILVGTDGSDSASLAVAHALHLARALDSEVTLLSVYAPRTDEVRGPGTRLSQEEARAVLGDAIPSPGPQARIRTRVAGGSVHRALLDVASDEGTGLIVVGSRRDTSRPGPALIRLLLEDAPCDVLVVDTVGGRRPTYRRIGVQSGPRVPARTAAVAGSLADALSSELVVLAANAIRGGRWTFRPAGPSAPSGARSSSGPGGSGAAQGGSPVGSVPDLSQSGQYDLLVVDRAAAGSGLRGGRLARLIEAAGTNVLVARAADDASRARRDRTGKEPRMARGGPEALVDVPLFAGLSKRHLRHIAGLCEEEEFSEGTSLAEEGKPGDTFYVLLEGEAKVVRGGRRLDRLIPGDFFGEIALIDGGPRTASVVATTPLITLTISRKRFRRMLEEDPSIVLAMLEELAKRLRNNERSAIG